MNIYIIEYKKNKLAINKNKQANIQYYVFNIFNTEAN